MTELIIKSGNQECIISFIDDKVSMNFNPTINIKNIKTEEEQLVALTATLLIEYFGGEL